MSDLTCEVGIVVVVGQDNAFNSNISRGNSSLLYMYDVSFPFAQKFPFKLPINCVLENIRMLSIKNLKLGFCIQYSLDLGIFKSNYVRFCACTYITAKKERPTYILRNLRKVLRGLTRMAPWQKKGPSSRLLQIFDRIQKHKPIGN